MPNDTTPVPVTLADSDEPPIGLPDLPTMTWHPPVLHPGGVPLHVGVAGGSRRVGLYHHEIPSEFGTMVRFATDAGVVAAIVTHDGRVPIIRFSTCYHVRLVLKRLADTGGGQYIELDASRQPQNHCPICGDRFDEMD